MTAATLAAATFIALLFVDVHGLYRATHRLTTWAWQRGATR